MLSRPVTKPSAVSLVVSPVLTIKEIPKSMYSISLGASYFLGAAVAAYYGASFGGQQLPIIVIYLSVSLDCFCLELAYFFHNNQTSTQE